MRWLYFTVADEGYVRRPLWVRWNKNEPCCLNLTKNADQKIFLHILSFWTSRTTSGIYCCYKKTISLSWSGPLISSWVPRPLLRVHHLPNPGPTRMNWSFLRVPFIMHNWKRDNITKRAVIERAQKRGEGPDSSRIRAQIYWNRRAATILWLTLKGIKNIACLLKEQTIQVIENLYEGYVFKLEGLWKRVDI